MSKIRASQVRELLMDALTSKVTDPEVANLLMSFGVVPGTATYMDVFVRQLIVRACLGDSRAISEVMDRLIGKQNPNAKESEDGSATYHDFLMAVVEMEEKKRLGLKVENDPMKVLERKQNEKLIRGSSEGESESAGPIPPSPRIATSEPKIFEDLL